MSGEIFREPGRVAAAASQPPVRRAVIDIGTNSIKLLVADREQDGIHPVFETAIHHQVLRVEQGRSRDEYGGDGPIDEATGSSSDTGLE